MKVSRFLLGFTNQKSQVFLVICLRQLSSKLTNYQAHEILGSPCPLDQVSIICFKRCPYLRSFILNICTEVLGSNTLPAQWTKAATILIHKKDDPSLPENFRPITLEPVSLKIFTSLLRNRVFTYLINNQYIESHYQKGFMPGMSGTFEHIAEMSHIINHSRKQ